MDIEVLTKGNQTLEPPIAVEGFTQVFEAPPVRAYRLTLKGNQQLKVKSHAPLLIVGLNGSGKVMANKTWFTKQGDFLFVQPSEKIRLANKDEQEYNLAVLELK